MNRILLTTVLLLAACGEPHSVDGQVVTSESRPIEGAWVKVLFNFECCDGPWSTSVEKCARTNDDGGYHLSARGGYPNEFTGTNVYVQAVGYLADDGYLSSGQPCSPEECILTSCGAGDTYCVTEPPADDWCVDGRHHEDS